MPPDNSECLKAFRATFEVGEEIAVPPVQVCGFTYVQGVWGGGLGDAGREEGEDNNIK